MAVDKARLSAMREVLQSGETTNVLSELQNLNTLMEAALSSADVLEMASTISLPLLFSCLNSPDDEQVQTCCAVLEKVFSSMSPAELSHYSQYIELGLQHTAAQVRKTSLKGLRKKLANLEVRAVVMAPTMFHLLTQVIGDDSLECANIAMQITEDIVKNPTNLDARLKQAFLLDLEGLRGKNDTVRYRVYELAVHVSVTSKEAFAFIQSSGLLAKLVSELDLEDVLVRLNCIELLVQLLETEEGGGFLDESQVLRKLHAQLVGAQQDPFGSFVIPGILKYFGHYSLLKGAELPAACSEYPAFLAMILEAVQSPQDDLFGIAVDTLGVLGSTVSGRKAMEAYELETKNAVRSLGESIINGTTGTRIRGLGAAATLLSCKEEESEASKSREWFKHLGPGLLSKLLSLLRQPFKDLRMATLKFLLSIASYQWAQEEMAVQAGFLEYLLDRRTEEEKEGKELKYEIVHTLVESQTAEEVFGRPGFLKLRQYDMEGAFFVVSETVVATEGSV